MILWLNNQWKSHTQNIKYSVHLISNPLWSNGTIKVSTGVLDYKQLWCNSLPQTVKTPQTILWIVLHINKWVTNFLDRKLFLTILPASIYNFYTKKNKKYVYQASLPSILFWFHFAVPLITNIKIVPTHQF